MTGKSMLISELVWPEEAYARSANIELDYRDPDGLPEFKFTPKSMRLLADVLDSRGEGRRDRAWSIVGPYGSGKSLFTLFLLQMLSRSSKPWLGKCRAQLELSNPSLYERTQREVESPGVRYIPVILQGSNVPLDLALCQGLYQAATDPNGDTSWTSSSFLTSLKVNLQTLEAGVVDSSRTVELFEQAADLAKIGGYQGLLVAVDEFGKFLERSAWQGELQDIISAQYLAELASGSQDPKLLFFVLVHQGFQHYAISLSQKQSLEWAKIQGRFHQVDFSEDPDNLYDLISGCLNQKPDSESKSAIDAWAGRMWGQVRNLSVFQSESAQKYWPDLLHKVYPFHPLALFALPRLSMRLGQNERTLFNFLASDDPLGFKRFLTSSPRSSKRLPTLTIDYLFDYFLSGARFATLPPDVQHRTSEIETAFERLGDRPSTEVRIIKALGIIGVLNLGSSLPSTEEVLALSLDKPATRARAEVRQALAHLLSRKIVVYRKFSGEYRIWQGSDFDFESAVEKTRDEIRQTFDLSSALRQHLSPSPLSARRHSFQTGTNRLFTVIFKTTDGVLDASEQEIAGWLDDSGADGVTVYILPRSRFELRAVRTWAESRSESRLLVVVPHEPIGVSSITQEIACLRTIGNQWPEIQDDPVAFNELNARIEALDEILRETMDSLMDPSGNASSWYWRGQRQQVDDRRQLNQLLSRIFDEVYFQSPRIRNELVNRGSLSSSVVVAVKKVIEGLLAADGSPGLGFKGNGAEVSILRKVFEEHDLYREVEKGHYGLAGPLQETDPGLRAVWGEIEDYFERSEESPIPATSLYRHLEAPPYGVRRGLIPLLIWAVLIANRNTVCIYENGTYIREWGPEVFDRFVKNPEDFTIRSLLLTGVAAQLVIRLNQSLQNVDALIEEDNVVPLTGFLEHLYSWYQELPDYSKRTLKLPAKTLEMRRTLTTAVDPIELISTALPNAMDLPDMDHSGAPEEQDAYLANYVSCFSESVLELSTAYTSLCNELVSQMARTFGTTNHWADLREWFESLDHKILEHIRDSVVKAFLVRARQSEMADQEWIESAGAALANQAPKFWMDHHYEEFVEKLALVQLELDDVRRRMYALSLSGDGNSSLSRITIERPDSRALELFLNSEEMKESTEDLAQRLIRTLAQQKLGLSSRQRQLILVRALELAVEKPDKET